MISDIDPRHKLALLRALRDAGRALSSADVARGMQAYGVDLSPRTVRMHMMRMEEDGLVSAARRGRGGGRAITPAGLTELDDAGTVDRLGFTSAKVDRLACQMRFDTRTRQGTVVINLTVIEAAYLTHAVREMAAVYRAGWGVGSFAAVIAEGQRVGTVTVPPRHIAIGTVCSVTANAVLLNARVPAISRFGAVLELRDRKPVRFTDIISYEGTTLDPLEVFVKAGLTDVRTAAITGSGRIGVSFREVPTPALPEVERAQRELERCGLGCILCIGRPNQPLLDFPVHDGRTGLLVTGGLNPAAAIEEAGIRTANFALTTLWDYSKLVHYRDLQRVALDLIRH